jgi:hypothetical protein
MWHHIVSFVSASFSSLGENDSVYVDTSRKDKFEGHEMCQFRRFFFMSMDNFYMPLDQPGICTTRSHLLACLKLTKEGRFSDRREGDNISIKDTRKAVAPLSQQKATYPHETDALFPSPNLPRRTWEITANSTQWRAHKLFICFSNPENYFAHFVSNRSLWLEHELFVFVFVNYSQAWQ